MEKLVSMEVGPNERGHNVDIQIHLMRHGRKGADGSLTEAGRLEALDLGESMGLKENVKAFTSSSPRVQDTAKAVQEGIHSNNQFVQRNREELSAELLRSPHSPDLRSSFFRDVVSKRLADANNMPEDIREEKIRDAEHESMQEWLSYGDDFIDETTNSPKNVARAVAHQIIRQIDMADRLKDNSKIDFLDVTHEFMLAALIKYAVEREDEGRIYTGDDIMKEKKSIAYLESLDINVQTDASGNKSVSLKIDGKPYILKLETLRELAREYKK